MQLDENSLGQQEQQQEQQQESPPPYQEPPPPYPLQYLEMLPPSYQAHLQ